ncbi:uncharacterized protein LOC116205363 [Punica granatum]|uniref:Uncharacterized protein LOC116205363 n=1 Tax=Punica granatum TaxID=22663 RepID=A0A6P8DH43_PUNGR|nr:uncharacterized protein LOC116205363 [Punica granatum]
MPTAAAVYTVPPPMVFPASSAPAPTHLQATELPSYPSLQPHVGLSYQAPPPINTTFLEPSTPTHAAQFTSPTHLLPEKNAEQERKLKRMEETIRALQANEARPDASYGDCSLFPGMRLPSKFKIPEFKTYEDSLSGSALDWFMSLKAEDIPTWADLSQKFIDQYQYCAETPPTLLELSMKEMAQGQRFEEYATKWRAQAAKHIPPISEVQQIQLFHSTLRGVYYSHLLAHTSSFSDLIEAGKKLDLGIKLGRMEGPTNKGEEPSKKASAMSTSSSGRKGKEVTVNAVNPAHPTPQQYSVNVTSAPPVVPTYAPQYRPQPPTQPIYYSALPPLPPPTVPSPVVHHYTLAPPQAPQYQPPAPRVSQPTQRVLPPQGQQGGAAQPRPRRQYPSLPVPLSHIYWQIRDKIGTIAPGPNFDPTIQDQSKQCEYHRGAPGHTLDTCWRLRERIQEMIDAKELVFNAVRSPNVQANPLPDHGPARGPSINMITICALGEGESEQGCPSPFVIEYVPAEAAVGYPRRRTVFDDKVPWTYEGGVGNLEQKFGVMGITRSGRVYENPTTTDKGKAPAAKIETIPGDPLIPPKKVTEEEAEAFMKIIKANEYKVVEQMTKSPAHISLLALLLSSGPHKEALLQVLTAAQVPKGTPPDRIEETVSSIFSNTISFSDDELPSEGCAHSWALHIVCNVTFRVLDIPNAFSLLLGRPWIHSAGAIPSSLHQKLKFIIEERIITVKGEEDYAIYKETAVPYISVGNDENLPFHSFETISVIRDY